TGSPPQRVLVSWRLGGGAASRRKLNRARSECPPVPAGGQSKPGGQAGRLGARRHTGGVAQKQILFSPPHWRSSLGAPVRRPDPRTGPAWFPSEHQGTSLAINPTFSLPLPFGGKGRHQAAP